jgi:hypothetical protein
MQTLKRALVWAPTAAIAVACSSTPSETVRIDPDGSAAAPSRPGPRGGDPCRSLIGQREGDTSSVYEPRDRPGDVVWIETPEITHTRDYYAYEDFVQPGAPSNWTSPVDLTEGQIWLRVEVKSLPRDAELPIYYTVTWQPGRDGAIRGFLRAAVEIDKPGPATYDAVADIRSIEYSPDGTCCQEVCDKPWPWDAGYKDVAGDVVVLKGEGFPLTVKTRIVLRPPRAGGTP